MQKAFSYRDLFCRVCLYFYMFSAQQNIKLMNILKVYLAAVRKTGL